MHTYAILRSWFNYIYGPKMYTKSRVQHLNGSAITCPLSKQNLSGWRGKRDVYTYFEPSALHILCAVATFRLWPRLFLFLQNWWSMHKNFTITAKYLGLALMSNRPLKRSYIRVYQVTQYWQVILLTRSWAVCYMTACKWHENGDVSAMLTKPTNSTNKWLW